MEVEFTDIQRIRPAVFNTLYSKRKKLLSFDCKFADGVKQVFPLLFLGPQTLLMLVELAAQSSGLLGSQIKGLVLFTLKNKDMS